MIDTLGFRGVEWFDQGGWATKGATIGRFGIASRGLVMCWKAAGWLSDVRLGLQLGVDDCVDVTNKIILQKIGRYNLPRQDTDTPFVVDEEIATLNP